MHSLDRMVSCSVDLMEKRRHQQKQWVFRHYPDKIPNKGLSFGVMVVGPVSSIYFPLRPNKRRSSCRLPRHLLSLDIQLPQPKTYNRNRQMREALYYKNLCSCKTLIRYKVGI